MKRSGPHKEELSIEIEQTEEMSVDDLDDILHILATIILRKQQKVDSSADDTER